jgi:hypothetical protein
MLLAQPDIREAVETAGPGFPSWPYVFTVPRGTKRDNQPGRWPIGILFFSEALLLCESTGASAERFYYAAADLDDHGGR